MDVNNNQEKTAAAVAYLRQGWLSQAFLLLSELKAQKDPAAHFALGLCHFRAGELPAAVSCFEQALQLLKTSSAHGLSVPQRTAAENSETFLKLAAGQIADKTYLNPMDADFCALFPKAAEQNVLMAMIDVYQQMGMNEKAKRLSGSLAGPVFEEYKKGIP